MSTPATANLFFSPTLNRTSLSKAWMAVLFGLAVICFESTPLMAGANTGKWLADIWPSSLGQANTPFFGLVHHLLRKSGHFTGYGTLGLLLHKAWNSSVRIYLKMVGGQLLFAASALAVSFTFLVGCMDEWHQSMIPGRVSCFSDVLIDTSGAIIFNVIFWLSRVLNRRELMKQQLA